VIEVNSHRTLLFLSMVAQGFLCCPMFELSELRGFIRKTL